MPTAGKRIIQLVMISSIFSRRFASRCLVRAFTTTSSTKIHKGLTRGFPGAAGFSQQQRLLSQGVASVDEDLDAALDSLLGDAFDEAEDPRDLQVEEHMKDSHPIPRNLVEEVSRFYAVRWVYSVKDFLTFFFSIRQP